MSLTREQILGAVDLKTEIVDVPEWGGSVIIRTMTAGERDLFERDMLAARKSGAVLPANIRASVVARCLVDESGHRLFTDEDITDLAEKSAAAMDRVFAAAQKLNALSDEDVDELSKN